MVVIKVMNGDSNLTLKEIELSEGIKKEPKVESDSGLSIWYNEIRDKKVSELTDGDIAKLIRQKIFLKHIVPETIKRLSINPTIGSMYDGEVLNAISGIKSDFWANSTTLRDETTKLVELIIVKKLVPNDFEWITEEDEQEFYENAATLKRNLGSVW